MKNLIYLFIGLLPVFALAQPNDCNEAVPGCATPSFGIAPNNPATNVVDFTSGSISNPSSNPGSVGNSGCLLSGETSSTFITINIVSNGTLQWSLIGLNAAGTPSNSGCFDWIMWPNTTGVVSTACAGINGNTLPPAACNWNGSCNANTGMASPANFPPGASQSSYENPLNVTAGQSFILCLSNYSGVSQNVNLNFFGTAQVVCGVSAPDQTICLGNSTTVTIATPGLPSPTFNWLQTNGVSNPTGNGVTVNPTVTTTYNVVVTQAATPTSPIFVDTATFTITVVPPPAPNAGVDQTICLGSPILLTGTPATPPNTIAWQTLLPTGLTPPATASFSPNFSSPTPTVTVNQPGTYKFILRETSTICGVTRDTMTVVVSQLNIATTLTHPSCGGYSDGAITITSVGASEYSFDNGVTWSTNPTMTGLTANTYNVCARNTLGCSRCTTAVLIDPIPVVMTVSPDVTICENGSAAMSASATGGTTFTFTWENGNTGANVNVPLASTQYFSVQAQNELGCLSPMDSILVTVRPPLTGSMSSDVFVCPTYNGTLTASVSGGDNGPYNFVWSNGSSSTGLTSSITENPSANTTYTVTVTDNCETTPLTLTGNILMHPVPVPQYQVLNPLQCEPAVFDIVNTTDPANSASATWRLSYGDEFINVNEIQTISLLAGTYDLELIIVSPNGCIDSTDFPGALVVLPKPIADFRWSPNPMTMFNTTAQFSNTSSNADSYSWTFIGGSPGTSTQETPQTSFPDGIVGSYEVILIANSDLGCSDTISKTVDVKPEVIIYAPNSFTPDGDEFNQTWSVVMEGIDPFDFDLFIFNRWGEIVWESHDPKAEWDGTYKGEIIKAGVYTWIIRTKDAINDKKYEFNGFINIVR